MYFIHKRKSKIVYGTEPIYLDIETAWNHDAKNPITWMVTAQVRFNGHYYLFRKPSELMSFYNQLCRLYNLNSEKVLVTYIHNASYDLSYLLPYIQECLPAKEDRYIICDSEHKITTYQQGGLCFRCSYMLTHISLAQWSKDMNVEHKKQVGLYDYSAIVYQDTELDHDMKKYDEYDVLSMEECLKKQMQLHHDNIATIPLTATGYIRRILRNSCASDHYYRCKYFVDTRLDLESYKFTVNSYAGGYTHNNRWLKSKVVTGNIGHNDFRSHYPTQIVTKPLPFGKPEIYYDIFQDWARKLHPNLDMQDIIELYPRFSTITELYVTKMELKDRKISMPFMQVSKMFNRSDDLKYHADNGRLLKMYKGSFVTYLDNLTLKIITEQYNIEYVIVKVYRFKNEMVPECIGKVINQYFKAKSDFKIEHRKMCEEYGQFSEQAINANVHLLLSKQLLNAIYGCMAMNPVRPSYDIDYEKEEPLQLLKGVTTDAEIETALDKYYNGRNNFLPYQVGAFITAHARYELYEYIKVIGYDNVLYCDTDSIFYLKTPEIVKKIEKLNAEKHKTAPYITDSNGKRIYYDVFEEEPDCTAFKGLHSKCYGTVENGELHLTIAGIPARTLIHADGDRLIYLTREEEIAGITKEMKIADPNIKIADPVQALNRLAHGYKFHVNTGTTSNYKTCGKPRIEYVDGHEIETAGGAIIQTLQEKIVKDIDCDETITYELEGSRQVE